MQARYQAALRPASRTAALFTAYSPSCQNNFYFSIFFSYSSAGDLPRTPLELCPVLSSQYEMNFVSRACRLSNSFISFAHWDLWFSPFTGWRKSSPPLQRAYPFGIRNILIGISIWSSPISPFFPHFSFFIFSILENVTKHCHKVARLLAVLFSVAAFFIGQSSF